MTTTSEMITRNDLKNIMNELLPIFYPVGSYYETSDTTFNPNTEWGGYWELESAGLVHVSSGTGYAVGVTGGNSTHNHTTSGHKLTNQEMAHGHGFTNPTVPNHTHSLTYAGDASSALSGSNPSTLGSVVRRHTSSSTTGSWSTNSTGTCTTTGGGVSNLYGADSTRTEHSHGNTGNTSSYPPYIVVNRWHRLPDPQQ